MKRISIFLIMVALIAGMVGCGGNEAPTINSLTADADWVTPFNSLNVTCDASDPDNDELSYEWTTSGGNITGTGPEVVWTAPQADGTYNITVVVRDGYGGSDTETLVINVCSIVCQANIELDQARAAIIDCMEYAGTAQLDCGDGTTWQGELGTITASAGYITYDAADFIDGLFRGIYTVNQDGSIVNGDPNDWGSGIQWDATNDNWVLTP